MSSPRLTSITGVARALVLTVGVDDTVGILTAQFGWDVAFQALAALGGEQADAAMWKAVEQLLVGDATR